MASPLVRTVRGAVVAAIAVAAAWAGLLAQQAPFRGGTDIIALDLTAVDGEGRPLLDLTKDEVLLRVDGKPREIQSVQLVRLTEPDRAPVDPRAAPVRTLLPFASNALNDHGRAMLVVIDHGSIRPGNEKGVIAGIRRMVQGLRATDRIGLATIPHPDKAVELTTDRAAFFKGLDRVAGRRQPTQTAEGCDRTGPFDRLTVYSHLTALLKSLAGQGGPTQLMFVSQDLPAGISCLTYLDEVERAAEASRASVYVLQPHDLITDAGSPRMFPEERMSTSTPSGVAVPNTGLQDLAGATGGDFFMASGTSAKVFERIEREGTAYYLLGFSTAPSERDGKPHRIEVSLKRPGVIVRSRRSFTVRTSAEAAAVPSMTAVAARDAEAVQRDLPLRAYAAAYRGATSGSLSIVVLMDAVDPASRVTSAAFGLFNQSGKGAAQWEAEPNELGTHPIRSAMAVPRGEYRLRVAAVDQAGRIGTVDYNLRAELTRAGAFELSSLMAGTAINGGFRPQFAFAVGAEVTGYGEIYGDLARMPGITFEVASGLDTPALRTAPGRVVPTKDRDRAVVTGQVALTDLPAGDYVLRAVVVSGGRPVGRVMQGLRIGG